jgi:hypothetical protein
MWGDKMENYISLFGLGLGVGMALVTFFGLLSWSLASTVRVVKKMIK